jgi:hypothetical protein
MITQETFNGGAAYSATFTGPAYTGGRVLNLAPTAAANLGLPDATELNPGGPYFIIFNSGTHTLTLRDADGGTVGTVAAGASGWVFLMAGGSLAGSWRIGTRVYGTVKTFSKSDPHTLPADAPSPEEDEAPECDVSDFELAPCSSESDQTVIYSNTAGLSAELGNVIKIDGDTRCFIVRQSEPVPSEAVSVTIDESYNNCRECLRAFELVDCLGVASTLYTRQDLSAHDGRVVRITGSSVCWQVSEIDYASQSLSSVTVEYDFGSCDCCASGDPDECGFGTGSAIALSWSYSGVDDRSSVVNLCDGCYAAASGSALCLYYTNGFYSPGDTRELIFRGYTGISFADSANSNARGYVWVEILYYVPDASDMVTPTLSELRFKLFTAGSPTNSTVSSSACMDFIGIWPGGLHTCHEIDLSSNNCPSIVSGECEDVNSTCQVWDSPPLADIGRLRYTFRFFPCADFINDNPIV